MKSYSLLILCLALCLRASIAAESFEVYDLYIDSGSKPLAAYQVSIRAPKQVQIISVEGGDHIAFQRPPFHDPKAIQSHLIRLAAFSVRAPEKLPVGRTRVASLHVQVTGSNSPEFHVELEVASNHKAEKITCKIQIQKGGADPVE